jgi:hypothetical protein
VPIPARIGEYQGPERPVGRLRGCLVIAVDSCGGRDQGQEGSQAWRGNQRKDSARFHGGTHYEWITPITRKCRRSGEAGLPRTAPAIGIGRQCGIVYGCEFIVTCN